MYSSEVLQVVLSICPNQEVAKRIAKALIKDKLAACVNIIPQLTSVYCWQDEIIEDEEVQLLIKTTSANFLSISEKIKTLHPYELPEIISLNIQQGDNQYLNWIKDSVK